MSIVFMLVLLSMSFASGALAESSTSSSYRLDYARFTSDSDQKTSNSYTLTDSISDISAEGSSASFNLRNVYGGLGIVCGNGTIETGEQCEGTNFNGLTCANYGFDSGTLQCLNCQIVTTSCFDSGGGGGGGGGGHICGNGIREASEQCDDDNTIPGDGCNAYCFIEPGYPPPEEPEEPDKPSAPEEPEQPLTFEPEYDPDLILVLEKPEAPTAEPTIPEKPGLKPTAPEEPEVVETISYYDYHFSGYQDGQTITVLDETPFIVTQTEPKAVYELVILDATGGLVTRQGAESNRDGILMVEGIEFLDYKTYEILLFDSHRELFKAWTITIEDRKYRLHENLLMNGEENREYIALGSFKQISEISGNGKPYTQYHAYIQKIESPCKRPGKIEYVQTQADENGNYSLSMPAELQQGSYLMNLVQVYEDGKVSRNKRYVFDVQEEQKPLSIWILLSILIIFLIGQACDQSKKKGNTSLRSLLAVTLILSIALQQTLTYAAVTTPTVFVYEGKLLDSSDNPITTSQTFRFSFWNSDDMVAGDVDGAGAINAAAPTYGGWTETHTLTPNTDGTFFVELGSSVPLPNMLLTTHTHLMVEIKTSGAADTSYELMDPTGDNGTDTDDRQTVGSVPYTNNADFIDNAEIGTSAGDIATLGVGGIFNTSLMPAGTDLDSWTIDVDDSVIAGTIDLIFGTTLAEFLSFDIGNDWFSFSNDVNFNQNEIKNVAIDNLAVAPVAPVTGQIYHNTVDGNTYIWNGVSWDDITAGATGVDDLDGVYGADADKKMAVNNASGLEFESTVAGDIVVDLQSTGDFVIQDAGTPFAIFTDGGSFGIGNTSPISIFHIDSNDANTAAIATLENTGGDIQFFRSDASPEGAITGSIGDLLIDSTNGNAYLKNSGTATNTGWLQIGGEEGKTAVFHAEYEDSAIQGDGTDNKGLLSSYFADAGGTNKYNYYEWTTRRATIQDVDIVISFRLPEDFQSFTATPLSILYQTSDGVLTTNQIDVFLYDTTGAAVSLTNGTNLANAIWTTANITFGGAPTFTAGDVVTLVIKPQTTNGGYARVSDVIFNYNGT